MGKRSLKRPVPTDDYDTTKLTITRDFVFFPSLNKKMIPTHETQASYDFRHY